MMDEMAVGEVAERGSGADVGDYVGQLGAAFAAARGPVIEGHMRCGPHVVRLQFAGPGLAAALMPAMAHGRVDAIDEPWLTIRCWDRRAGAPPRSPWSRRAFGPAGEVDGGDASGVRLRFDPIVRALNAIDGRRRIAYFWSGVAVLPPWFRAAPFLQILHWACAQTPLQPIHAGAIGGRDGGVLLAGPSGAGKSTTALACVAAGLHYAGDDYVLADSGTPPSVHSLYSTAKLARDQLARLPALRLSADAGVEHLGKVIFAGGVLFPERLSPGFTLRAIVLPRRGAGRGAALERVGAPAAVKALLCHTLTQLRGSPDAILAKLTRLARSLPCYVLRTGDDPADSAAAIVGLIAREAGR